MPVTNISGFQELLPAEQIAFDRLIQIIKAYFELYGFVPLETCVVEKTSTLLSKGNDNEIYGIYRLAGEEGSNKKDLGLRFDLTVPLARYVAQNYSGLTFPYRRYHIAPVWRGERPQAGRYRQFYQCDIDIIGDCELSTSHDSELLAIISNIFGSIGIKDFTIKINNRNLLIGLLKSFGVEEENIPSVIRVIDKIHKISKEELVLELSKFHLSEKDANFISNIPSQKMSSLEWISYLKNLVVETEEFKIGLSELEQVILEAEKFGAKIDSIQIDPSLARGLNYYTGTVFETVLDKYPELGSVCGGGRYANLAGSFTNKKLPGVGISIGISRLFPKLIEMGLIETTKSSVADILVTTQNKNLMSEYIAISQKLRSFGIKTEIYLQDKPLASQMKYASKKGISLVLIADSEELKRQEVIIRDMNNGQQNIIKIEELKGVFNG